MKTAVISDIHANLEALEAVLTHAAAIGADHVICLGDVVGYNADPAACVERLRDVPNLRCLLGNHDAMAVGEGPLLGINAMALAAITWTREHLDPGHKAWLAGLPLVMEEGDATFSHASLDDPTAWRYVNSAAAAARHFAHQRTRVGFIGHSHLPFAWREDGMDIELLRDPLLDTTKADRWLVSVGSVGQPRDHDPRAAYALFDDADGRVEQVRLEYDVAEAQRKILAAGLPPQLAERLA